MITDTDTLSVKTDPMMQTLNPVAIQAAKKDILVRVVGLIWMPWRLTGTGSEPAWK